MRFCLRLTISMVMVCLVPGCAEQINTICPIMGGDVDTENLTPELTREFKGRKVGFCCPPCLEEWDELTDAEKEQRLSNPGKGHGDGH